MEGLAKAAQAVGLQAEGVQVSREALANVQTPCLAWIDQGPGHYVAVLSLQGEGDQGTATIHDPNQPYEQTIAQEQLLRLSGGYLLLLHR